MSCQIKLLLFIETELSIILNAILMQHTSTLIVTCFMYSQIFQYHLRVKMRVFSLQDLLCRSHIFRVLSWLPETTLLLSPRNLAARTFPLWPVRVCCKMRTWIWNKNHQWYFIAINSLYRYIQMSVHRSVYRRFYGQTFKWNAVCGVVVWPTQEMLGVQKFTDMISIKLCQIN